MATELHASPIPEGFNPLSKPFTKPLPGRRNTCLKRSRQQNKPEPSPSSGSSGHEQVITAPGKSFGAGSSAPAWASARSNHGSIPRVTATAALGPSPRRLPSLPGRRQWPTCASGAQHQHRTQRCHRTHRVHRASTPLADAGGSAGGWFCAEPWGRRSVSIINSHLSLNPIGTASLQPRRGQAASAHAAPKVPGMSPQR